MRKRRGAGRLAACLLAAVMMFALMVPSSVSAATSVSKKTSAVTISRGQSYHIMNNSISTNQISSYSITITPKNSATRYDVAAASSYTGDDGSTKTTETLLRSCSQKVKINNSAGTFIKTSASANKGMLACISVRKGSVTVQVTYKTTNTGSTKVKFVQQKSSHQPLKYVKTTKGQAIRFTVNSSNLGGTPLVVAGRNGYTVIRALTSTSYEKYAFGSSNLYYRIFSNGTQKSSSTVSYSTSYSKTRCLLLRTKQLNSGWLTTSVGTIYYYYPSDYANITYETRTVTG